MQFTKLGHSCVRLEKDGAALVIDPGIFTDAPAALNFAAAVLVTHEHPDHLDADAVREALFTDSDLTLWATPAVADQFKDFGDRVHQVRHGDALAIAGFDVHVYGEKHALIHQDIPLVANTGFMVDGSLFHPGDQDDVRGRRPQRRAGHPAGTRHHPGAVTSVKDVLLGRRFSGAFRNPLRP